MSRSKSMKRIVKSIKKLITKIIVVVLIQCILLGVGAFVICKSVVDCIGNDDILAKTITIEELNSKKHFTKKWLTTRITIKSDGQEYIIPSLSRIYYSSDEYGLNEILETISVGDRVKIEYCLKNDKKYIITAISLNDVIMIETQSYLKYSRSQVFAKIGLVCLFGFFGFYFSALFLRHYIIEFRKAKDIYKKASKKEYQKGDM